MKISNSKKQLARIIHENGGWRDEAKFSAQDKDAEVFGYCQKPIMGVSREVWGGDGSTGPWAAHVDTVRNWHQTILSRDEYFHLYPVAQTAPEPVEVVVENKTTCHLTVTDKPTIEQLAADYRNAKDYADRKQQEADAAKADAEAKLAALVAAGKALGLVLSVVGAESELAITDWRDLRVGDVIKCVGDAWDNDFEGSEAVVTGIESHDYRYEHRIRARIGEESDWGADFHFIRRPVKGDANA